MGNETSGFAVLNLSSYTMHMGLSIAATHYYENNVNHGEIFYRWPGALYYTVYAQTAPEISDDTRAKEFAKSSALGITAAASVIAQPVASALAVLTTGIDIAAEGDAERLAEIVARPAGTKASAGYKLVNQVLDVHAKVDAADKYVEKKGCYGGGSGTWLVLRGGRKRVNGNVTQEKLRLETVKPEYILNNGKFTSYSRRKFYTTDEAKKHTAAVHSCHRCNCELLS